MKQQFNRLSPAKAERLFLLLEELGEAQQAIGKILRHGYESKHPDGGPTNRESLERELGDVAVAISLLTEVNDLAPLRMMLRAAEKAKTVRQYMHHQS